MAGPSKKVNCATENQKFKLLRADNMGDIKVTGSEHVANYKTTDNRPATSRPEKVISGVAEDLTKNEVMEETNCIKATKMNRLENGKKVSCILLKIM